MSNKIMVVDDEKIVVDMAKMALEHDGYVVETFLSGKTRHWQAQEETFDVGRYRLQR